MITYTMGFLNDQQMIANRNAITMKLLLLLLFFARTDAVLPQLALDVKVPDNKIVSTLFASHAFFGQYPSMDRNKNPVLKIVLPYEDNSLLCNNGSDPSISFPPNSLVLIPRGECTFETKAINAQRMGAKAVVIRGTLASRYTSNHTGQPNNNIHTVNDTIWPVDRMDYDCTKGRAMIASEAMSFDPLPYNPKINDPLLTGNNASSLCWKNSPDQLFNCESKMCLLTGKVLVGDNTGSVMEACCAWDLHLWLYADTTVINITSPPPVVTIPVAYVTAEQGEEILNLHTLHSGMLEAVLSSRWRPKYNSSAILIWLLGTVVAATAAYLTASDYHQVISVLTNESRQDETIGMVSQRTRSAVRPETQSVDAIPDNSTQNEEILELTAFHAVGFVFMASSSLLILFYFKIYGIVKVFYAIGCSTAVSQVILTPIASFVMFQFSTRNFLVWRTNTEDFGDITVRDVFAYTIGYSFGVVWLYMAITIHDPERYAFFWIMQDLFGACMCITFLKVIRLNSIRVAAILLIVAFFYDIFFVFITPMLFHGKSVMITVATSGGPPKADALWCEKYPDDKDCQGGNPMPMLLAIPKLFDFMGGSSLLGLGDIVLPGLLLSFAARMDAAKSLLGKLGGGRGANNSYNCVEQKYCGKCFICQGGYFAPLVLSYAIGLAMANTAVYVMQMGQPALLYLVPCCLGTLIYIGWRRNELADLWDGPKVLRAADNVVHEYSHRLMYRDQASNHLPLPLDERQDALAVPSAEEADGDGNMTLLNDRKK